MRNPYLHPVCISVCHGHRKAPVAGEKKNVYFNKRLRKHTQKKAQQCQQSTGLGHHKRNFNCAVIVAAAAAAMNIRTLIPSTHVLFAKLWKLFCSQSAGPRDKCRNSRKTSLSLSVTYLTKFVAHVFLANSLKYSPQKLASR